MTQQPENKTVIPAKAGTQPNVTPSWVPDQVRDDKGGEGSNTLKLTDEAFSENTRAARYLASRDGVGDFSKFVTDGIETDGNKAIAETVDLYRQTAEINKTQADALIKKVMPGLSPDNAKRLQSAIKPKEDKLTKNAVLQAILNRPSMDEDGHWRDANDNPIPNPDADPRVHKAAARVPGTPTIPGGINPATPEDIDKALENASKDARNAWDALKEATGVTDADLYGTPFGKALLMSNITKQGLGNLMGSDERIDIA